MEKMNVEVELVGLESIRSTRGPGRRPLGEGSAEDTRRVIYAHAMRLFNERGYAAAAMSLIAKEAGLTKATLYYHFPGKAELLTAGALDLVQHVRQHIDVIVQDQSLSVRERLARMVRERYDRSAFMAYNAAMMEEAMQHLSLEQRNQIRDAFRSLSEPLVVLISEGMQRGELRPADPEVVAFAFRQLFSSAAQREMRSAGMAHLNDALLDLFFEGAGK